MEENAVETTLSEKDYFLALAQRFRACRYYRSEYQNEFNYEMVRILRRCTSWKMAFDVVSEWIDKNDNVPTPADIYRLVLYAKYPQEMDREGPNDLVSGANEFKPAEC